MKLPHVMIDIETLGTATDAALVQLGAVRFDPFGNVDGTNSGAISQPDSAFRMQVHMNDPLIGHVDAPTVRWWLTQPERTQQKVFFDDPKPLADVLDAFQAWVEAQGPVEGFWAKGSEFDFTILRSAYERTDGIRKGYYPVDRKKIRCLRTLIGLVPNAKQLEPARVGTAHDAMDDAFHQAGWAIILVRELRKLPPPPMSS